MMYFDYPIDTKALLRKKKKIKNALLDSDVQFITKRVAILGGSTTEEVADQLELFLLHYGIKAELYQSPFGKYMEEALFPSAELEEFKPDIVYIHTTWRNITEFPTTQHTVNEISQLLQNEFNRFVTIWESIENRFSCPIIQNNFDRPNYRLLGNKDVSDPHGRTNYISRLNQKFYEYSQNKKGFYINDIDYIASDYGVSAWSEGLYWHMYKYGMCVDAIPHVADSIAKIIKAIYGKNKKVLALDLDNTLWGGVIGDDGVEGITIGPEVPKGQVYSEFQEFCKAQKSIGVVLAVNSKNDEENAIKGLNHPDSVLKQDDFVSIKANWDSKDNNIRAIAEELTLGIDSFVFIDDNPVERDIVRKQTPNVAVPELERIEDFIRVIDHSGYFEVVNLSTEDSHKTELYHAKAKAAKTASEYADYGEYLDSLEMKAIIKPFEEIYVQRIAQLTNKSNQFNLTTLRCTEEDICRMMMSDDFITLYGKLEDKFGDNGVVTVVAGEIHNGALHIRLWLMSCRVLKRELEDAMMDVLVEESRTHGIGRIYGYYYPTAKNNMVKDFYTTMGFEQLSEEQYMIKVSEYQKRNTHIMLSR